MSDIGVSSHETVGELPSASEHSSLAASTSTLEGPSDTSVGRRAAASYHDDLTRRVTRHLYCMLCRDLPTTCYQCSKGHLMCEVCLNQLLADAHLKVAC